MNHEFAGTINQLDRSHAALKADDIVRLRSLSMEQRGALIEAACLAAADIQRSRAAAGLPPSGPAPWPAATREFMKRHAARVRT
jgi:hypothetical protein